MTEIVIKVIGNYSYQTSKCLGQGVYGKVYEGSQKQTKQKVAIKKIDLATFTNDKYLQNAIFSQIYLLKRFNHPNIVKFKDVLSSKNSLYIITEFCKNGDLKQLIKRKKFKEDQTFEIIHQIMNGFSELVRQKIVHRDLKPANILINQNVYKICDFGFAKYVDNFGTQMLKSCVGSPIYMAPQILQRTQYTTKCDVWSLGIIFYEMIFGHPPWKARDQYELLRGIRNIPITHIIKKQSISSKAADFLKRTLAYKQQQRAGWGQLIENFGPKSQVKPQITVDKVFGSKQRNRIISNNSWNQNTTTGSSNNISSGTMKPLTLNKTESTGFTNLSPEKRRTYSSPQMQNTTLWRQYCIQYNFLSVELLQKYSYLKHNMNNLIITQNYGKLLLILSMNVKIRSTYCLTLLNINYKQKNMEQLQKKMKSEHQSYQMVNNDIVQLLQRQMIHKKMKDQITMLIGRNQIINQQKIDKTENLITRLATELAQYFYDQIKKKGRNSYRDTTVIEVLDLLLQILNINMNKSKSTRQYRQSDLYEIDDEKNYVSKVLTRFDTFIKAF